MQTFIQTMQNNITNFSGKSTVRLTILQPVLELPFKVVESLRINNFIWVENCKFDKYYYKPLGPYLDELICWEWSRFACLVEYLCIFLCLLWILFETTNSHLPQSTQIPLLRKCLVLWSLKTQFGNAHHQCEFWGLFYTTSWRLFFEGHRLALICCWSQFHRQQSCVEDDCIKP